MRRGGGDGLQWREPQAERGTPFSGPIRRRGRESHTCAQACLLKAKSPYDGQEAAGVPSLLEKSHQRQTGDRQLTGSSVT